MSSVAFRSELWTIGEERLGTKAGGSHVAVGGIEPGVACGPGASGGEAARGPAAIFA